MNDPNVKIPNTFIQKAKINLIKRLKNLFKNEIFNKLVVFVVEYYSDDEN